MNNKKTLRIILFAALAVLIFTAGFISAKFIHLPLENEASLTQLHRDVMAALPIGEDGVTVIGDKSPDSDTVCCAIAWSRLLNSLGFKAEPAINGELNRETLYILKEAGAATPPILTEASGKDIFLVDHSEYAQATKGMEEAHIVGIIDHHGIGTVTTGHQVYYEARPIGATATIIWMEYLNCGEKLDKETAFLLLGAVLSDTDGLKGSTTTDADRKAVPALAKIAGVKDTTALYRKIHEEKLSYEGMTNEEILFSDYKEYETNDVKYGIGLVNAIDEETARGLCARMKEVLPAALKEKKIDMMFASVGVREDGEKIDFIVPADEHTENVFKAAFPDYDEYDGTAYIFRTGLGRKTKFVPPFTEWLNKNPGKGKRK